MSDSGEFEFIAELGRGAFGTVYLIKGKEHGDMYALKTVNLRKCGSGEKQKALEEANVMQELDHNHVVKMFDSYMEENNLFLFTEYCEGGDLAHFLEDSKEKLPEDLIVCWVWQVSSALSHMHSKGILHRDLKPQNVYLTRDADLKLGDLGIARVLDAGTDMASTMAGTPCYMSPEIFSMKGYNAKTDIWSFGCVVYEVASKERAYDAPVLQFLMFQILSSKTPPVPDEYSAQFQKLVNSMLRKDPDQRPSADQIMSTSPVMEYANTMKRPCDIILSSGYKTLWGTDTSTVSEMFKECTLQPVGNVPFNVNRIKIQDGNRQLRKEPRPKQKEDRRPKDDMLQTIVAKKGPKKEKIVKKVPSYTSTSDNSNSIQTLTLFVSSIMDSLKLDDTVKAQATLKAEETLKAQATGGEQKTIMSTTLKNKEMDFLLKQIVVLQQYCAEGIGDETLQKAYAVMSYVQNPADLQDKLVKLIGKPMYDVFGDKIMILRLFEVAFQKVQHAVSK